MSVDDRLRSGLQANAAPVVPEGEARLVSVRARHRRRLVSVALAGASVAAATVVVLVSLTVGAERAAPPVPVLPAETATSAPTPTPAAGLIPESTWRKVVTVAQAADEGVSEGRIRDDIGADGRLPLEMRLLDGSFIQSGDYGGSVWQIGDSGTVTYDERGRLVVTSSQCATCSPMAATWHIDGARLVITRLSPPGGPMARAVWLGTWRRTD